MKLEFDKFRITGNFGDYVVEIFGEKVHPRTKEKSFGLIKKRYHGRFENALREVLDNLVSSENVQSVAELKDLLKAFLETVKEAAEKLEAVHES